MSGLAPGEWAFLPVVRAGWCTGYDPVRLITTLDDEDAVWQVEMLVSPRSAASAARPPPALRRACHTLPPIHNHTMLKGILHAHPTG